MNKSVCMNCEVVQDLLPLYIDKCCSEESVRIVESHLKECADCKTAFDSMCCDCVGDGQKFDIPRKLSRINDWKASVLQTALLFVSFAVLAVGITLEAYTPYGATNGIWAFWIIVPVASFMLSLSNWYFIRAYKNRKMFSNCSCLFALLISAVSYAWGVIHYRSTFFELSGSLVNFLGIGLVVLLVMCIASKVLSDIYAKMLGKE